MLRPLARKRAHDRGFTLIEVLIAITILTVGVLSMALLGSRMMTTGQQSKYMSAAAQLASEKLEDLNRWDTTDAAVSVPVGIPSVGSLGGDVAGYFDDVNLSVSSGADCPNSTAGCFSESGSSVVAGVTTYTTIYHSPDGRVWYDNAAPNKATFHRRWVIEANQPVVGTRRVTVLVTLANSAVKPAASFQMSIVRP